MACAVGKLSENTAATVKMAWLLRVANDPPAITGAEFGEGFALLHWD